MNELDAKNLKVGDVVESEDYKGLNIVVTSVTDEEILGVAQVIIKKNSTADVPSLKTPNGNYPFGQIIEYEIGSGTEAIKKSSTLLVLNDDRDFTKTKEFPSVFMQVDVVLQYNSVKQTVKVVKNRYGSYMMDLTLDLVDAFIKNPAGKLSWV